MVHQLPFSARLLHSVRAFLHAFLSCKHADQAVPGVSYHLMSQSRKTLHLFACADKQIRPNEQAYTCEADAKP